MFPVLLAKKKQCKMGADTDIVNDVNGNQLLSYANHSLPFNTAVQPVHYCMLERGRIHTKRNTHTA